MHIISIKALRDFWVTHPPSELPLRNWHTVLENTDVKDFTGLKDVFNTADYVKPYTIFDVAGNNYRLITVIHYNTGKVYIRWILTHRQYDEWNKKYQKGKV